LHHAPRELWIQPANTIGLNSEVSAERSEPSNILYHDDDRG
jgi:hypothetical protein